MAVNGNSVATTAQNVVNLANAVGEAAAAISALSSAADFGSAIRAIDIPTAAEVAGDISAATAAFNTGNAEDWRVRLSMPTWPSFGNSPVLAPLMNVNGLVFPYTPQITVSTSAKYQSISTMHTNFQFQAYQHSEPGSIQITAPMNVEDPTQGLYWLASLHYLRSMTKMFTGYDPKAGNPPPIVYLNGYGQYVFSNVPVAVSNFSMTLDKDCDYIGVNIVGSAAGSIEGYADAISIASNAIGSAVPGTSGITAGISSLAGGAGQIAAGLGLFGIGGSVAGGVTHVPTKSTFTITLLPMYSRNTSQKFSLDRFVEGGYLNSSPGYI